MTQIATVKLGHRSSELSPLSGPTFWNSTCRYKAYDIFVTYERGIHSKAHSLIGQPYPLPSPGEVSGKVINGSLILNFKFALLNIYLESFRFGKTCFLQKLF
jgi:hypothetical protein